MTSLFLFLFSSCSFDNPFDRALVQKYLLEKTRICFQAKNERNYHVFYHLLVGSSPQEKQALHLLPPGAYRYLNQVPPLFVFLFSFYKPKPFVSTGLIWLVNNVIIDRVTITIWMKVMNATSCHDSNNRWSLWDFAARHSVASFPSCRPSCTLAISSSSQRNRLTITTSRWRWKTRPSSPPLPSYWELKRKFCIKRSSQNGPEHPERRSSSTTVCQRYI